MRGKSMARVNVEETIAISGLRLPKQVIEYYGDTVLSMASKLIDESRIPEWIDKLFAAEVYYAFYLPIPTLAPAENIDSLRLAVLKVMLEESSFWRVKPQTSLDRITSLVASASFIERIARLLPRSLASQLGDNNAGGGTGYNNVVRRAVEEALARAAKDAKTAKNLASIVYSSLPGSTSELAFEDVLERILLLSRNTDISKVLDKISGVKIPGVKSRTVSRYSRGWIEGVEIGSDVERIHYSMFALPDELFYALLAESRLLLYRKVVESVRGPVYVLMDKSGSMSGTKIDWARAVAVALMIKSIKERRGFYARFFDASPHDLLYVKPTPKPKMIIEAMEHLANVRAGGGTDITRALVAATTDISRRRVKQGTDIVLITDGEDSLSAHVIEELVKGVKARLHTVMIGGDNETLRQVSDSYMKAVRLDEREMLKVVDFVKVREAQHHKS